MWILWPIGMILAISFVCNKTRPQPIKAPAQKMEFYTPHLIEPDVTIFCKKDLDIRG